MDGVKAVNEIYQNVAQHMNSMNKIMAIFCEKSQHQSQFLVTNESLMLKPVTHVYFKMVQRLLLLSKEHKATVYW